MCDPVSATVATIGVASSAVGYAESKSNANAQLDYQNQQSASHAEYTKRSYEQQAEYQQRVADYQQEVYQQELSYRDELIDYQDKLFAENTARANDAAMRNYSEILTRLTQEEIAGAMEIEGIRRSSKSQQASALADMYDRGVDGNLADYLIDSIAQVELADIQAINQERVWRNMAAQANLDTVATQREERIESMIPQPIAMPTLPAPQAPISEIQGYQGQMVNQPSPLSYGLQAAGSVANAVAATRQPQTKQVDTNFGTPSAVDRSNATRWMGYGDKGWRQQSYKPSWVK